MPLLSPNLPPKPSLFKRLGELLADPFKPQSYTPTKSNSPSQGGWITPSGFKTYAQIEAEIRRANTPSIGARLAKFSKAIIYPFTTLKTSRPAIPQGGWLTPSGFKTHRQLAEERAASLSDSFGFLSPTAPRGFISHREAFLADYVRRQHSLPATFLQRLHFANRCTRRLPTYHAKDPVVSALARLEHRADKVVAPARTLLGACVKLSAAAPRLLILCAREAWLGPKLQ